MTPSIRLATGGAALDGDAVALWLAPGLPTRRRSSSASIHVRSLDTEVVERTARQFVPRLGRSGGTAILPLRDGWIAVYDELCDRDRKAHRCLAEELSVGRLVDECLSVPDHYRPLPTAAATRHLVAGLGALLGLHGAAQGYAATVAADGALVIDHGAGVSPG